MRMRPIQDGERRLPETVKSGGAEGRKDRPPLAGEMGTKAPARFVSITRMKFSVVTADFNRRAAKAGAVASDPAQSWPEVEHVIQYGGSKDHTRESLPAMTDETTQPPCVSGNRPSGPTPRQCRDCG